VLENQPSEFSKTAKFVRAVCFPPSTESFMTRSSFAHAVEAALIEEQCLGEAERCTLGEAERCRLGATEVTRNTKRAGQRQSGKPKRRRPKRNSRKALERTHSHSFNMIEGTGSVTRRATLQLSVWSREGQLSLFDVYVNDDTQEATSARTLPSQATTINGSMQESSPGTKKTSLPKAAL